MFTNTCARMTLSIGMFLGTAIVAMPQGGEPTKQSENQPMPIKEQENSKTILAIFRAIEDRNDTQMPQLFQPDFEIHWPPSLPYGGTFRGLEPRPGDWGATWTPLQPTEQERRMDARVVAAHDDDVVVLWHQRGLSPKGERFDGEVLGMYQFREGKLARAQMFYFDTAAVAKFLAKAKE